MYHNTCFLKTRVFEKNNGPGGVIMLSRMKTVRMWAVGATCEKRPCGPYGRYAVPTARMRAVRPAVPAARNL